MSQPRPDPVQTASKPHPGLGCLARLFWMGAGNIVLIFAAWHISNRRGDCWALDDTFYWAAFAALVLVRLLDVVVLKGDTGTGEPATMSHWRRYALILTGVAVVLWLVAHAIAWPRS